MLKNGEEYVEYLGPIYKVRVDDTPFGYDFDQSSFNKVCDDLLKAKVGTLHLERQLTLGQVGSPEDFWLQYGASLKAEAEAETELWEQFKTIDEADRADAMDDANVIDLLAVAMERFHFQTGSEEHDGLAVYSPYHFWLVDYLEKTAKMWRSKGKQEALKAAADNAVALNSE